VDISPIIYGQIRSVAEQQNRSLPPLTDDVRLMESGLDSLCIAILIATLDDELRLNPFDRDDVEIPVTIGDLVRIYENAAVSASSAAQ
jgi:acyl carrier protein